MLGVTIFGLAFTPVFYVVVRCMSGAKKPRTDPALGAQAVAV